MERDNNVMLRRIDCESTESTWQSVCAVLGISAHELRAVFDKFTDSSPYDELSIDWWPMPERLAGAIWRLARNRDPFDSCWFHLTRVPPNSTFSEGIQPLPMAIERIWNSLRQLVLAEISDNDWSLFRNGLAADTSRDATQYCRQLTNPARGGPYAVLIREAAFRLREINFHNYLRVPEIVEDISNCFQTRFGIDLIERFVRSTRPCIVKFIATDSSDALPAALTYLHGIHHGNADAIHANTVRSGNGVIPASSVIGVEFPEEIA